VYIIIGVLVLVALVLFLYSDKVKSIRGAPVDVSIVTRSFDKTSVYGGENVVVTLSVDVQPEHIGKPYTIKEYVPAGWVVADAGDGTYNSGLREIRWLVSRAPITDPDSFEHTYTLTAPGSTGTATFDGDFVFSNNTVLDSVVGVLTVDVTFCTPDLEKCDNIDNNCDYNIDEGCDDDNDDYCDLNMGFVVASDECPKGPGDCDDNPLTCGSACNPGITSETCDNYDNDCSNGPDDGCDDDNDDWCDLELAWGGASSVCPNGNGDCNDDNVSINPGASELCNGVNDDCDAGIDEDWVELGTSCGATCGFYVCATDQISTECSGAGILEECDNIDNQCLGEAGYGLIDEGCDDDGDHYCDLEMGYSDALGIPTVCPLGDNDCNDDNSTIHPGAIEECDSLDNNCMGGIDEQPNDICTFNGNIEPDEYLCTTGNCLCLATYEEDHSNLAWTVGDCSGCVSQVEITTYGFNWLNGESEIGQIEVTTAVNNWETTVSSC